MLSSHLPRTLCDKFVYDFPWCFWSIAGGYELRRMCSHCLRASCNFLYGSSGAGQARSVQRSQWSCCVVSATSAHKSYGARAEPVRLPCRGCAEMVRWPWHHRAVFERAASTRCPCGDCAMPPTTCLRAYKFFNLYNFPLNKIVEATELMNPYKNLTAASCFHMEASWRPHGKGIRAGYRLRRPIAGQMWTRHYRSCMVCSTSALGHN